VQAVVAERQHLARDIATFATCRPRRFPIRSKLSRSGPPPRWVCWAASTSAHRSVLDPSREMWPSRALPSELLTEREFAVLVDHRDMRTAAMQVDADRIRWAYFDPGSPSAPRIALRAPDRSGGPPIHDIKGDWSRGLTSVTRRLARPARAPVGPPTTDVRGSRPSGRRRRALRLARP
jgi:hypothetical protein